jgi:hypothetical protein
VTVSVLVVAVTVADRVGVVPDSVVVTVWVFDVVVGEAAAVAVFAAVVVLGSVREVDCDLVVSLSACVVVVDGALLLVVTGAVAVLLLICSVTLLAMLWPAPEPHPAMTMASKPASATGRRTDRVASLIRSTERG